MPGRISPSGKMKNIFGGQLRVMREAKGLTAVELVARLGVMGWDVSPSSISQIESGQRVLGDVELLMILQLLGASLQDLKIPHLPSFLGDGSR